MSATGYDAVLLLAFGGPERMEDVRPFLQNVLRDRPVTPERFEQVVSHYAEIGGRSPINEITAAQTGALARALAARGVALPVCFAMRNWSPSITDVLSAIAGDGQRRVLALILAAQQSAVSTEPYVRSVEAARCALGARAPQVDYADGFHTHPGFIRAHAEHVAAALHSLPEDLRDEARVIFTAHSIPSVAAAASPYVDQLQQAVRLVAAELHCDAPLLCYQSRSGRPEEPWLGPDVLDVIRSEQQRGTRAVVVSPIGFVCDHVEVLYDLDVEAKRLAQELGVTLVRARSANDHPDFIDALADVVVARLRPGAGVVS